MDDDLKKQMRQVNREAENQHLDWGLIHPRRQFINETLKRIDPAAADDIFPETQALLARVNALPWSPSCPKSLALLTALNEAQSLLTFGGKSLPQLMRELSNPEFTDQELSLQFCDSFAAFKNLSNCVIAAPGALRKLKSVIEFELSELEGRPPAANNSVEPVNRDDQPKGLEIITNLQHD